MRENGERQQHDDQVEGQQERVQHPRYSVRKFLIHHSNLSRPPAPQLSGNCPSGGKAYFRQHGRPVKGRTRSRRVKTSLYLFAEPGDGNAVEDAMFFGRGAGELPTASAVVGDVFDIVRNILIGCCGRIGCTCYKEIPVKKMEDTHNRYFIRLKVEDRCGVLAEMTAIFAKYQVSVAQIIQKDTKVEGCAEVVVITEKVREGDFRTAIEELRNRDSVRKISTIIRVYGK